MQSKTDDLLIYKIKQLEDYLNRRYPDKRLKIHDFLDDLNLIKNNLTVIALLNYLVAMYNDGISTKDIITDVDKTKKIFYIANEYISASQQDYTIGNLSKEIHEIILQHLERALEVYKKEYCI